MNTPAHAIINLLILSRNPTHKKTAVIISGAVIPDLVIIAFYAWHSVIGTAEQQIWSVEYYDPIWQAFIDSFKKITVPANNMDCRIEQFDHLMRSFLLKQQAEEALPMGIRPNSNAP